MRMVATHDFTDNLGRFAIGLVGGVAANLRGIENAAMHRLQPVTHIGQRAADNHAHRVIEIAGFHLIDDVDASKFFGCRWRREIIGLVAH